MTSSKWMMGSAIAAVVFVAACGSDSTTQPGHDLTTQQLQSMTSALSTLLGVSLGTPPSRMLSGTRLGARSVSAVSVPIGGSVPCPAGGRVGTTGTFSTDGVSLGTFALTDTLVSCAVKDNHSDVWTFTSKPTIAVTLRDSSNVSGDSIDLSHLAFTQTDVGSVEYESPSVASATCALNMSIDFVADIGVPTADSATLSLHTRGKVCGRDITRDTSSTVPYQAPPP